MGEISRVTQYVAAIAANLGGFALGTVIGWFSPAQKLIAEQLGKKDSEITFIGSIMPLGAATAQIFLALLLDRLGRKWTMVLLGPFFIAGWVLLGVANSMALYCIGRFVTGFCGGAFCVAAPTYIGELADKEVRGTLGVFFQLLLVIGIMVSYSLSLVKSLAVLTYPLAAAPAVAMVILIFLPESPVLLFKKGNVEGGRKALQFFRGKDYDIEQEIKEIEEYNREGTEGFWQNFKTRANVKGFLMLLGLHAIQQLSGINSVMFFAEKIFSLAGGMFSPEVSAIITGGTQVLLTCVSAALVDRSGRKLLWIVSLIVMSATLTVLGLYFIITKVAEKGKDEKSEASLAWLPIVSVCAYLAGFSLGAGPLPWAMLGEMLSSSVKAYCGSAITMFNWLLAFLVTMTFESAVDALGAQWVFWIYAIVCALGVAFVVLFLLETKNKTLEQIQAELGS